MNDAPELAILLAAHGSTKEPETGRSTRKLWTDLHQREPSLEVQIAFWKEEPALDTAMDRISADHVVVVPMLMSDGYFFREHFPAMLGIECLPDAWQPVGTKQVFYSLPIGESDLLSTALLDTIASADERLAEEEIERSAVIVVGHGTPRNKRSTTEVQARVQTLRSVYPGRAFRAAFIDDKPALDDVFEELDGDAIVIPWFLGDGMHPRCDIPAILGLDERNPGAWRLDRSRGHRTLLAPALGESANFATIVARSALDTFSGVASNTVGDERRSPCVEWLASALEREPAVQIGRLRVTANDSGYTVRNTESANTGPNCGSAAAFERETLDLREDATPVPYSQRTLKLPAGCEADSVEETARAVEAAYPGILVALAREADGVPAPSFAMYTTTLAGNLSKHADATEEDVRRAINVNCLAYCERAPVWAVTAESREAATLPCRAPCHAIYASLKGS